MKKIISYIWKYTRGRLWIALGLHIFLLGTIVLPLLLPIYYKEIIDAIVNSVTNMDDIVLGEIYHYVYVLIFLIVTIWVCWRGFDMFIIPFQIHIIKRWYKEAYLYLQKHSYRFFSDNFWWALVKKVNRFTGSLEGIIDLWVFNISWMIITIPVVLCLVFLENVLLGWIFVIWLLLFSIAVFFLNEYRMPLLIKEAEKDSKVSGELADSITNHFTVSIFGSIKREFFRFSEVLSQWSISAKKSWYLNSLLYAVISFGIVTIQIAILLVSVWLWRKWNITIGVFVLMIQYTNYLIDRVLLPLNNVFKRLYNLTADAKEMIDILETPHEVQDKKNTKALDVTRGKIEFKDIDFSYIENTPVFSDFTLTIQSGEKVALVGESGSGKSTIIKLLFRFFDVQKGQILIDGQDITDVTQEDLRQNIGMVPQEPLLFHRTLQENIAYGKTDASIEDVQKASAQARADVFIEELPNWYNTMVGERGVKLSGGERQRVAIARALLENAHILVLDEATSSLDSESEKYIQEALDVALKNKTAIVIAHRLSTIMKMDRIIVLDKGRIIEEGTHTELLKKSGRYKKLWDIQSGSFDK